MQNVEKIEEKNLKKKEKNSPESSYPNLQEKFFSSESEEDNSEVEPFILGEADEIEDGISSTDFTRGLVRNKFLLSTALYDDPDVVGAAHHHAGQTHFDPETHSRLVALLEAADPEVLRRLTSSVSCALDEAAAALTRMRSETTGGTGLAVGGPAVASGASCCGSSSSSSCSSGGAGAPGGATAGVAGEAGIRSRGLAAEAEIRSLVEACTDGDVPTVKRLLGEGRSVHETTEEGESLLSLACSAGYYELAQVLLAMRANVEDRGVKGDCTPLMEGASAGHVEIVKLLLAHNADVNAQSSSGNTPLMYACSGGHSEVVKVLLENGANVEDHNENGHTPLMEAASAGHVEVAVILLERGAGINTHSNEFKESALTLACYKGHLDMVRFLLGAGADQEHKTDEMHTALMEASMDGHVAVARLLLDSGAQVNMPADSFESPLTLAACGGHTELALLLLARGANIEEVNDEGYTPLMEAAREGHEEMVTLLLAHGADINAQTEETQETGLTLACCGGFRDVADLLIKAGADMELGASTPLMEAAQEGHRELVEYLLEMTATVNAQTSTGDSALTYACENGHTDVADLLLQAGAHLEHESEGGRTPLMKACRAGHLCTVQFLLAKGSDVNRATANNDHTPLSLACASGHVPVVELLLVHGADPHHKLKDNSTMLMEASRGGHTKVVTLLIDFPNSISHILPVVHSGALGEIADLPPGTLLEGERPLTLGLTVVPPPVGEEPLSISHPPQTLDTNQKIPQISLFSEMLRHCDGSIPSPDFCQSSGSPVCTKGNRGGKVSRKPVPGNFNMPVVTAGTGAREKVSISGTQTIKVTNTELLMSSTALISPAGYEEAVSKLLPSDRAAIDQYMDTLLRKAEAQPTANREEQIFHKQQILEELQRVERELQGKIPPGSYGFPVGVSTAGGVSGSPLSGMGGTVSYPAAAASLQAFLASQHEAHASGFLASGGWAGFSPGMMVSDPMMSLYGGGNSHIPITLPAEGAQVPASFLHDMTLAAATPIYHTPASPPAGSHSVGPTGPATTNVPVSERPKMVPLKKVDKKKQQQKMVQMSCQHSPGKQTPILGQGGSPPAGMQLLPEGSVISCTGTSCPPVTSASSPMTLNSSPQVTPRKEGFSANLCCGSPISPLMAVPSCLPLSCQSHDPSCQSKMKGGDGGQGTCRLKDKKRSAPLDCDCHLSGSEESITKVTSLELADKSAMLDILGPPLAAQINMAAVMGPTIGTGGNLQFLPAVVGSPHLQFGPYLGTVPTSVPLSYGHLPAMGLGQAALQQHQHFNFCPVSTPTGVIAGCHQACHTAACAAALAKTPATNSSANSTVRKVLLQQPPAMTADVGTTKGGQVPVSQSPASSCTNHTHVQPTPPPQTPVTASNINNKKNKKQRAAAPPPMKSDRENAISQTDAVPVTADSTHDVVYTNNNATPHCSAASASPITVPRLASVLLNDAATHCDTVVPSTGYLHGVLSKNQQSVGTSTMPVTRATIQEDDDGVHYTATGAQVESGMCPYPAEQVPRAAPSSLVDVDIETDSNHDTALTLACAGGHEELVQLLLQRGANIEHRDKKGFTPLILASTAGHSKVVESLLAAGALIEAQSERTKDTPLSLACSGGRYDVVEILLQKGANKEHRNVSDYTPLSLAASGGFVNIIKLLLDTGAEINSRTGSKLGISPLMLAAMNGHVAAVKLLLDMGSDINAQIETNRNTALTLACFQGRHEVVSLLLDRRANVEHRAKTGLTPLMEAASGGYVEVGRVLLDKGADVNAPPVPSSRDTALTIAADKGHYKFVELLIQRGSQVEVKNKKGNSPLWLAAHGGHMDVVQLLCNASADIDSEDNRRVSCLMAAFKRGHYKVVKFMVRHVAQFPSDQELARYIATLNDKELSGKCRNCMELIRAAKDKQALEANKNATILLEQLEQERSREESRRAAAVKRRARKKAKKQEKREEKRKDDDDESDDDEADEEETKEEEEAKKEVAPVLPEERDGDSGIDSNSQTSATSETKAGEGEKEGAATSTSSSKGKKKKKKTEAKEDPTPPPPTLPSVTEEVPKPFPPVLPSVPVNQVAAPSVPIVAMVKSKKKEELRVPEKIELQTEMPKLPSYKKILFHESSRVSAIDTFGEPEHQYRIPGLVGSASSTLSAPSLSPSTKSPPGGLGTSPKKGLRREEGWKEVTRKSKRVAVANNAISRVIGRGGCNINMIREASGAHIEIEKQGKSQGDRMISIKGSMESTKMAQNLIAALIRDPDKDLSELIPPKPPVIRVAPRAAKPASVKAVPVPVTTQMVKHTLTTTTPAWSNMAASPKRFSMAPQSLPIVSNSVMVPMPIGSKSPAVRQLFTGDVAKRAGAQSKLNAGIPSQTCDSQQSFAAKLADSAAQNSCNAPLMLQNPAPTSAPNQYGSNFGEKSSLPEANNNAVVTQAQEYSIFSNLLSQVTQDVMRGGKDRQPNFAAVAASGLPANLSKQQISQLPNSGSYLDPVDKPLADVNLAPGYRGATNMNTSTVTTAVGLHMNRVSPSNFGPSNNSLSSPPQQSNSMGPRSAPGTPISSPMRPIPLPPSRQTSTPPPGPRGNLNFGPSSPYSMGPSNTPPPSLANMMRMPQLPQASLAPGAPLPSRGPIFNVPPPPFSMAPGGPVSSLPRGQIIMPDHNDMVNLAPGQPYRKPPPQVDLGNLGVSSFHALNKQPPFSSLAHLGAFMNGPPCFTAPQTNPPHPVFTNNMGAPISSSAPTIHSNLNPNAPDFTSRTGVSFPVPPPQGGGGGFPTHMFNGGLQNNQTMAFTVNQYLSGGGIDQGNLSFSGQTISEIMNLMAPSRPGPPANNFRSNGGQQGPSPPLESPPTSSPASPAQSIGSKLQPIGTERAQKRSVSTNLSGNQLTDMMWPMQYPEVLQMAAQGDHNLSSNAYYNTPTDMANYEQPQLWNNWNDRN